MMRVIARKLLGRQIWTRLSVARSLWEGEEKELFWVRQLVRNRSGLAFDVGANHGLYTKPLSLWAERVVAFEPNPHLCKILNELQLANVCVECLAVGDHEGAIQLRIPVIDGRLVEGLATTSPENQFASENIQGVEEINVHCTSIDDYVQSRWADVKISFMKIDVEGFEDRVLRGASDVLREYHPPLLVEIETRHGGNPKSTFEFLAELGYVACVPTENNLKLIAITADDVASVQQQAHWQGGRREGGGVRYINSFFFLQTDQRDLYAD